MTQGAPVNREQLLHALYEAPGARWRVNTARLCRRGGSQGKPSCDGTHARIGFRRD